MMTAIQVDGLRDWLGAPEPDAIEATARDAELGVRYDQRMGFVNTVLGSRKDAKGTGTKTKIKKAKGRQAVRKADRPLDDAHSGKVATMTLGEKIKQLKPEHNNKGRKNPIGFGVTPDRVDPVTGETIRGTGGKKFRGTTKLTKAYKAVLEQKLMKGENIEDYTLAMMRSTELTIAEVVALGQACLAASGGKGSTHAARELREATEGRTPQKIDLTGFLGIAEIRNASDEELKKIILEGVAEIGPHEEPGTITIDVEEDDDSNVEVLTPEHM